MAKVAAAVIAGYIRTAQALNVAWCTGRTVIPVYEELLRLHHEAGLRFDHVRSFDLDEYFGLEPDHPASFRQFLHRHLFTPVQMSPAAIHLLDGSAASWARSCQEFEATVEAAGGIDLLLDGIGANGHLGFNEPGSEFGSDTRLVDLTEETREGQLAFFPTLDAVPHQALTRGIRPIMQARAIVLMASGAAKAEPLRRAFLGPVTPEVPCSVLQLHPNLTLVLDRDAARPLLEDPHTARYVKEA